METGDDSHINILYFFCKNKRPNSSCDANLCFMKKAEHYKICLLKIQLLHKEPSTIISYFHFELKTDFSCWFLCPYSSVKQKHTRVVLVLKGVVGG